MVERLRSAAGHMLAGIAPREASGNFSQHNAAQAPLVRSQKRP